VIEACPGCGAQLERVDGPTHRYLGASSACWQIYSAHLTTGPHALLIDAYAAQHPGVPSPQSIQSVGLHLLTLHAVLAHGSDPMWARRRVLRHKGAMQWLTPPAKIGDLTIVDVGADDSLQLRYITSVYEAWLRAHRATVEHWHATLVAAD
jgi:hypothetical protein